MHTLKEVVSNPGGFDSLDNYMGEIPTDNWLCVLTHSRDSDALDDSNFRTALKRLGGEGINVRVERFGHWACGWWEALAVNEGTKEHAYAIKIREQLEDYPVLDEEDYSSLRIEYGEECEFCYSDYCQCGDDED